MARTRRHAVVKAYLDAYRKLVVGEPVLTDHVVRDSIVLSVPLHFSGDHRVEVTVTQYSPGKFILSDMARTLGELEEGGRSVTSDFRKRAKEIARSFGVSFRLDHMILDCGEKELGQQIQRFAEAAKTIGDAYLLQRTRTTHVRKVIDDVKGILAAHNLPFEANKVVDGEIDKYDFNFYVPPNGKPGVALAVIAGQNTKQLAKIWDFNCRDIREAHGDQLLIGLVLDERDSARWTSKSQKILKMHADMVAPSSDLSKLDTQLAMRVAS